MDAALEEFAAKGYAGARVADIAARAGLNKQLISYYFGGKAGLFQEMQRAWLDREEKQVADPQLPLADLVTRYLHEVLADPRPTRLLLWQALAAEGEEPPDEAAEDLSDLLRRQADGELAADLDPGSVLLIMMAMVAAPLMMPRQVVRSTGLDPRSPEFEAHYGEQLRRVVRHLAGSQDRRSSGTDAP
jgi:AcrR family transcriptional regulator